MEERWLCLRIYSCEGTSTRRSPLRRGARGDGRMSATTVLLRSQLVRQQHLRRRDETHGRRAGRCHVSSSAASSPRCSGCAAAIVTVPGSLLATLSPSDKVATFGLEPELDRLEGVREQLARRARAAAHAPAAGRDARRARSRRSSRSATRARRRCAASAPRRRCSSASSTVWCRACWRAARRCANAASRSRGCSPISPRSSRQVELDQTIRARACWRSAR